MMGGGSRTMSIRVFQSVEELRACLGREVGRTDWIPIDQERIDRFADATGDHNWIHVDPRRAAAETPFGATIAHGFLTLSLLPMLLYRIYDLKPRKMSLNYGLDRVRFMTPVPVDSRVRGILVFNRTAEEAGNRLKLFGTMTIEREGAEKPACVADFVTLHFLAP